MVYRNMKELISGVKIDVKVEQVEEEDSGLFSLKGNAAHATFISINGREIFIQKNGDFEEKIALPEGYSVITLFARNKFGKDREKSISIYTSKGKIVAYENKKNY